MKCEVPAKQIWPRIIYQHKNMKVKRDAYLLAPVLPALESAAFVQSNGISTKEGNAIAHLLETLNLIIDEFVHNVGTFGSKSQTQLDFAALLVHRFHNAQIGIGFQADRLRNARSDEQIERPKGEYSRSIRAAHQLQG